MAFVFLGANTGVNTPRGGKTFCLQESKTRTRDEKRENQQSVYGEKNKDRGGGMR